MLHKTSYLWEAMIENLQANDSMASKSLLFYDLAFGGLTQILLQIEFLALIVFTIY